MPIEYDPSDGYYYHPGLRKIILDANTAELIALKLAHEANHAKAAAEGKTPDVNRETRDNYVKKMLKEEIVGTVGPIELKRALAKKGKTITATFPLEKEYNEAYKKAVDALKKSKPGATEAELDAAGKKAGYEAVKKGFETGKVVTSVRTCSTSHAACKVDGDCPSGQACVNNSYPVYYGDEWDKKHPRPTPTARP